MSADYAVGGSGRSFHYVVTDEFFDGSRVRERLSTPEGLEALGLKPGEVDAPVFAIGHLGRVISCLNPDISRNGFSGYNWESKSRSREEIIEDIRGQLCFHADRGNEGEPRAVIQRDYEKEFRQVAEALGLVPRKIERDVF